MDRSTLKILNSDFTFLGDIEDYISFYFVRNFFQAKEFQFVAPIKYTYLLSEGNYIYLSKYKSMIIEEIEINEEKGQIIAKGRDIKSILERRVTVPPIGLAYDEFKGSAEEVIKHYIQVNCITPVDASRKISNLEIAPNKNRGGNIKWQSRYKNLISEIEGISKNAGLGWFVYLDQKEKKFIFDVEIGVNRTESQDVNSRIIFSSNFDNVSKAIHKSSSLLYKNIGYVGGRGEGVEREIIEVRKKDTSELDRREIFIDARDIAESDKLEDRGLTKLNELDYVFNTESTVLNNNLLYEKDWNLGDLVTIKNNFGVNNLRVTEVREIYESKLTIEVVVGTIEGSVLEQINSDVSGLSNENTTVQKIWKPTIASNGEISWEINSSLQNPSIQNVKGPKGDIGATGSQGLQGLRGETGLTGVQGSKGDTGLKGATGERGVQGEQGIQGGKGDKGDQGIQGSVGSTQSYIVFHQHFIATEGQTLFEWNDGYTYPLNVNAIAVYLNGVRLSNRIINQLRSNAIQFKTPLTLGAKVFIEAFQMVVDLQGPKGATGATGATGIPGLVGQQGIKGDKGDIGITGTQGIRGIRGLQGEIGLTGIQGAKGDTGAVGAKGDKGDTGIQGVQGIKGDTGISGPQGLKGDTGLKGDVGSKGATGVTGSQGQQGIQGIQGEKGDQGIQGAVGSTQSYIVFHQHFMATEGQTLFEWNDGYTYPLNVNAIAVYLNGVRLSNRIINQLRSNAIQFKVGLTTGDKIFIEAYQMVVDLQGPKGEQGLKGNKGDIGLTGLKGEIGLTGAQGLKGNTGATGSQGLKGDKGDTGATGPQGLKGDTGTKGNPGDKGAAGAIGYTGQQGIQGVPGTKGEIGATGLSGQQGIKGDTGAKGTNGIQGIQGPKGDTGAQGIQGVAGKEGTEIITSSGKPSGQISGRVWVQLI